VRPVSYSNPDMLSVVDINECEISNLCTGGTCVNTAGSYKCQCPTDMGFISNTSGCFGEFGSYYIVIYTFFILFIFTGVLWVQTP